MPSLPPFALAPRLTPRPSSTQGSAPLHRSEWQWEEEYGDDFLTIAEVREDGWVMESGFPPTPSDSPPERPLLLLPPEVAQLGVPGVSLSCIRLRLCGGVWQPFSPYCERTCVANAYPPTPED